MFPGPLRAVIWDFDGTLVDSRRKNLRVTRRLVELLTGRPAESFRPLRSLAAYDAATLRTRNWRELYQRELGLSAAETEEAGRRWGEYQCRDGTHSPYYDGIAELIAAVEVPQGIVSQNAASEISHSLENAGLGERVSFVVGHESIPFERQKPHPESLVVCLERLTDLDVGTALFVGDHEVDTLCAHATNHELERRGVELRVRSVAACYGSPSDPSRWERAPHHVALDVADLRRLVDAFQQLD
jgi:phosphoglycolate phosphatase-like HAD superfamily hydrolase